MNMRKTTIMIEDVKRIDFRTRLDKVLNDHKSENILSIDTGVYLDEDNVKVYYAFLVVLM